jgi:hypothetical protein
MSHLQSTVSLVMLFMLGQLPAGSIRKKVNNTTCALTPIRYSSVRAETAWPFDVDVDFGNKMVEFWNSWFPAVDFGGKTVDFWDPESSSYLQALGLISIPFFAVTLFVLISGSVLAICLCLGRAGTCSIR